MGSSIEGVGKKHSVMQRCFIRAVKVDYSVSMEGRIREVLEKAGDSYYFKVGEEGEKAFFVEGGPSGQEQFEKTLSGIR